MSNHEAFPLVEQGPQEEAGLLGFGAFLPARALPDLKNYATLADVQHWCSHELYPLIEQIRSDRQGLEEEWHEIHKMNQMKHGAGRRYFGRSDQYMPIYRRERSKLISTLSKGLFPSDDYFDCVDESSGDPEAAKPVKAYMQWEMDQNARLRAHMKPLLANLVDYGTAPMKWWYRKQLRTQGRMDVTKFGSLTSRSYAFKPARCEGLAVSARPLYYWYIYPYTCDTIDDAQLIFEDIDITYAYAQEMGRIGRWDRQMVEQMLVGRGVPQHDMAQQELLDAHGLHDGAFNLSELAKPAVVTEIWTYMILPRSAYLGFEDPCLPIPARIVMCNGLPMEVRRNPFFHQRPPYSVLRMDVEAGLFYGSSQGRTMGPLQFLSNDFINQANDNGILAMNPIALINLGHMVGPPRPFSPGVPWFVNDVEKAVKFHHPPFEQVGMGMQMAQMIIGMAQDSGGAPPDRSTNSKGSKTATGMQVLQRNALVPLQDVVEDAEIDGMVPMLWGGWKNAVQFRDQTVMASVAGEVIQVDPEMLAIEARFAWKASSQAVNNQMRSQQAMQLIQATAPLLSMIMQQGYIVDFVPLLKKVYTDGMGFRGFSEFIKRAPIGAAPMAPGMTPPGVDPSVMGAQTDNMRSALAQEYGGGSPEAEPQPGEADAFANVRQEADGMAALIGGGGAM